MTFNELQNTKNVRIGLEDRTLYLACDLSKDYGVSSTGKSIVIASSCGNKPLGKSNAFLGLNLFAKSLEKRQLNSKAVEKLQKDIFEPVGTSGLSWRIEDDGVTLCIKLDFDAATEKPAGSGKSILLFSTLGNKVIAETGIMCGLNCYRPENQPLNLAVLSIENSTCLKKGEEKELDSCTRAKYVVGDNQRESVVINVQLLDFLHEHGRMPCAMKDPSDTSLQKRGNEGKRERDPDEKGEKASSAISHSFHVGDVQVQLHVRLPAAGKRKMEASVEVPANGGLNQSQKLRNVTASLGKDNVLSLSFDPTLSFGLSSSGKSLTVASSSGFQPVYCTSGTEIARFNFNAFKPSSSVISVSEVDRAVKEVLAQEPEDSRSSLSFKTVRDTVLKNLDLPEKFEERYNSLIKERIKLFLTTKED